MDIKIQNYLNEKINSERKCAECKEKNRFRKAKKVSLKDYEEEYIYDNIRDEYYPSDELSEQYESDQVPKYVYGCDPIRLSLDMYSIVENECVDNHFEDAFSCIDSGAIRELQEMVDKWCKEEGVSSCHVDWNTVVLL
nr:hypothetical protein [Clostridioides sp.]